MRDSDHAECGGVYFSTPSFLFSVTMRVTLAWYTVQYLATLNCDFREIFCVRTPRPDLQIEPIPDPLPQLGEGLGAPKLFG